MIHLYSYVEAIDNEPCSDLIIGLPVWVRRPFLVVELAWDMVRLQMVRHADFTCFLFHIPYPISHWQGLAWFTLTALKKYDS